MSERPVWPGRPFPLGAIWDGEGTNFSLFSEHAERVELCFFDDHDRETRRELPRETAVEVLGKTVTMRRGAATLVVDLEAKTVDLHA